MNVDTVRPADPGPENTAPTVSRDKPSLFASLKGRKRKSYEVNKRIDNERKEGEWDRKGEREIHSLLTLLVVL